ncbi:SPW repeat protein [Streptomyces sp. AM 2-1-1]|uniref:SPW repeat protein n=1 Tax=Streptomyces sp. AM 2-1-1 TaxID=3028709 RepID=UPI0023B948A9|nr:SPW repeat protein [Streptomyces sp. AM 2-1-1]WEH41768.1 SPW repeat protein [Streptomyces sp. AM 2-1-1]
MSVPTLSSYEQRARHDRLALLHGWREQIMTWLMMVTAIVLCFAPWIWGDGPDAAKDAHRNELAVGIVVLLVVLARFSRHAGPWSDWTVLAAGGWLVASPWILGLQKAETFDNAQQIINVATGTVLIVLAVVSLTLGAALRKEERAGDTARGHRTTPTPSR